jgi:lipopolysaccharide transport system ATP-binding protein
MGEVAKSGRTVLFVSHNLAAVMSLCQRALVLEHGSVVCDAPVEEGIDTYLQTMNEAAKVELANRTDREGNQSIRYVDMWFEDHDGQRVPRAIPGNPLRLCMQYTSDDPNPRADFALTVYGRHGIKLFHCATRYSSDGLGTQPASGVIVCEIPKLPMLPGRYWINLSIWHDKGLADRIERAAELEVIAGDFYGTGKLPSSTSGNLLVEHQWAIRDTETRTASESGSTGNMVRQNR